MITTLLIFLIGLDVSLLGMVFFLRKQQTAQANTIDELVEERRILEELRQNVQADLEMTQGKTRETVQKISKLAAEAEQEVKQGGATLAKEVEDLLTQLTGRFEGPIADLTKNAQRAELIVKKAQQERKMLSRSIQKAEQLISFFDKKVPYEEILSEIEDKKYSDARALITKGIQHESIAEELGLPLAEVKMLAGVFHGT